MEKCHGNDNFESPRTEPTPLFDLRNSCEYSASYLQACCKLILIEIHFLPLIFSATCQVDIINFVEYTKKCKKHTTNVFQFNVAQQVNT